MSSLDCRCKQTHVDPNTNLHHAADMSVQTAPLALHQPFASLLAMDPDTGKVTHASANSADTLGQSPDALLGAHGRDQLGSEFWHALCNAASYPDFATDPVRLHDIGDLASRFEISACAAGPLYLVEIAPKLASEFGSTDALDVVQAAMTQMAGAKNDAETATELTRFLHRVTGYDHVIWWRAPAAVAAPAKRLAEAARRSRAPADAPLLEGAEPWRLENPTVRVIADINAAAVPLIAAPHALAAPDLSHTLSVAPTAAHAFPDDTIASLSMKITCFGQPVGLLEFRSPRPMRPSPQLLAALRTLGPYLDAKLHGVETL